MGFSVTCSNCDRSFVDIDESLIGQQARCKCGTVIELDPVWDFQKNKTNSRRPDNQPVVAPEPNKPATRRRRPARGSNKPTAKTPAKRKRKPAAVEQPTKPKPRQQAERPRTETVASTAPSSPPTEATPESQSSSQLVESPFDNYSDLDQILAGGVDHTPLESTRVDSPFVQERLEAAKPNRRGLVGAILGGLAGLATAFGLLVTRLFSFDGTPLGWTGNALYGSYTASVGTGEMTPAITSMFIGIGWLLLLLAVSMGISSVLLLSRVGIRISSGRKAFAWSRGLLATLAVVSLFSLLGLLFVETIHHGNLMHDLDSFSESAPLEGLLESEERVVTFQDVRTKYKTESTDFMIGVLTFAVLPLISFGGVATSLLFDER